jgi:hypothetical protein
MPLQGGAFPHAKLPVTDFRLFTLERIFALIPQVGGFKARPTTFFTLDQG